MKQRISIFLAFTSFFFYTSALDAQDSIVITTTPVPTEVSMAPHLANETPTPLAGETNPPAWKYFWMFKDGTFSRAQNIDKKRKMTTAMQIRGTYTGDDEPPLMMALENEVGAGVPNSAELDAFLRVTEDNQRPQLLFEANWNGAILGDSVFFVAIVKNRNEAGGSNNNGARSGYLRIRFPQDTLGWVSLLLPENMNRLVYDGRTLMPATADAVASEIHTWRIDNLPPNQLQSAFFILRVLNSANKRNHPVRADLQWDEELPNVSDNGPITGGNPKGEKALGSPNANYFRAESTVTLSVDAARDPNSLEIWPDALPPASAAPPHALTFRINVENTGGAPARRLKLTVNFDPRVNLSTVSNGKMYIGGNGVGTFPITLVGNRGTIDIDKMLQQPVNGYKVMSQGYFEFTAYTKSPIALAAGDKIVCDALIEMYSDAAGTFLADKVPTGSELVHIVQPGRLKYGTVLSLKASNHIPNADSAGNRSLSFTLQIPLRNPTAQSLSQRTVPRPSWWWQVEAGIGNSQFRTADDFYRTQLVHLNPLQLRYTDLHIQNLNVGLSAGYSMDVLYRATRNGTAFSLPSNLGKRLEHELAASVDFLNLAGVPGIDVGAGYKWRQNRMTASSVQYGCLFGYARVNFALFQRRQMIWWNKIVRW